MLLSFGGAWLLLDKCCEVLGSVQPLGGLFAFLKPQLGGVLGRGGGTFCGLVSEISQLIFLFTTEECRHQLTIQPIERTQILKTSGKLIKMF